MCNNSHLSFTAITAIAIYRLVFDDGIDKRDGLGNVRFFVAAMHPMSIRQVSQPASGYSSQTYTTNLSHREKYTGS